MSECKYKDGIIKYDDNHSFLYYKDGELMNSWYIGYISSTFYHLVVYRDIVFSYWRGINGRFSGIIRLDISSYDNHHVIHYFGKIYSTMSVVNDYLIYFTKKRDEMIVHCNHLLDPLKSYIQEFKDYDYYDEHFIFPDKVISRENKVCVFSYRQIHSLNLETKEIDVDAKFKRDIKDIVHYNDHIFILLDNGEVYIELTTGYHHIQTFDYEYSLKDYDGLPYMIMDEISIPLISLRTKDFNQYYNEMGPYLQPNEKQLIKTLLLVLKRKVCLDILKIIFKLWLIHYV